METKQEKNEDVQEIDGQQVKGDLMRTCLNLNWDGWNEPHFDNVENIRAKMKRISAFYSIPMIKEKLKLSVSVFGIEYNMEGVFANDQLQKRLWAHLHEAQEYTEPVHSEEHKALIYETFMKFGAPDMIPNKIHKAVNKTYAVSVEYVIKSQEMQGTTPFIVDHNNVGEEYINKVLEKAKELSKKRVAKEYKPFDWETKNRKVMAGPLIFRRLLWNNDLKFLLENGKRVWVQMGENGKDAKDIGDLLQFLSARVKRFDEFWGIHQKQIERTFNDKQQRDVFWQYFFGVRHPRKYISHYIAIDLMSETNCTP